MRNKEVIYNFLLQKKQCKNASNNLEYKKGSSKNITDILYNYNVKIACIFNNKVVINSKYLHYSKTTQTNINNIIKLADELGYSVHYALIG